MTSSPKPDLPPVPLWRWVWLGVRAVAGIALIVALVYGLEMLVGHMELAAFVTAYASTPADIAVLLVLYAVLLALPFVPGVEIGIAVMALFGPFGAVAVYIATVLGLMLSFSVGFLLPERHVRRFLTRFGLRETAVVHAGPPEARRPEQDRLVALFGHNRMAMRLMHMRYVAVGLLFNMPGNVIVGGGGGIAMLSGLSRSFTPPRMLLTVAIAVCPVPLAVFLFGSGVLG